MPTKHKSTNKYVMYALYNGGDCVFGVYGTRKENLNRNFSAFFQCILLPSKAARHTTYTLTTQQHNTRIRKPLVLCCMFLAKWKITRKKRNNMLLDVLSKKFFYYCKQQLCVYIRCRKRPFYMCTYVVILHCILYVFTNVISDLFITNQILLARTQEIGKSVFRFILLVFATAYCQNVLQKPSISPQN